MVQVNRNTAVCRASAEALDIVELRRNYELVKVALHVPHVDNCQPSELFKSCYFLFCLLMNVKTAFLYQLVAVLVQRNRTDNRPG